MKKQSPILLFFCMSVVDASVQNVDDVLKSCMNAWNNKIVKSIKFLIKGISTININIIGRIMSQKNCYDTDSFKHVLRVVK